MFIFRLLTVAALGAATLGQAQTTQLESHENDGSFANVEVINNGTENVTFSIDVEEPTIADIIGFFFDLDADFANLEISAVTGTEANGVSIMLDDLNLTINPAGGLTDLGGGINLNGTGESFQAGVSFGTNGIGGRGGNKLDVRSVEFTLSSTNGSNIEIGDNFGLRLGSVGADREGSSKLINSELPPQDAPFSTSAGVAFLGMALVALRRRFA